MPALALFFLSLVKPLVGRILVALGIAAVSVVGINTAIDGVKNALVNNIGGLPADMFNLFLLSGMGQAIGIITGAITTKIMIVQATKAFSFASKNQA
ncbi:DUF2523 domain-containing protein [Lampropedia puyangensis]|uniref:DUF2523 domain-containing protein n=1 Tax=Lampropedia puyangensis TaxID=1330072 RepID=A0A4S8ETA2_9BURK|nr:DUF2523 domain-containing protein [Lampropedia puyangensis]THT98119.1 DUF2523 domain-containing protein [Lampropedia puyangensis]